MERVLGKAHLIPENVGRPLLSCTVFNLYDSSGQDARTTISSQMKMIKFKWVTAYLNPH
ncbi:hypothetical protein PN480_16335 [Dolichospermum circinale CS-1225]|uniref:hypothetical protein n=1 Tax=Dolichospermum circinale TaxID=109265 RepID=UPI000424A2F4|nr:hypothetical protein [Dolichospermum circinale]MDB9460159.1 hypothetical protein [Dolichospermum circinale CS-545/17]MDB9466250.1 hypothetical protein [Dolichospermum circinale CS-539/09]MDB9471482.1 hypothetical protein [Dolichospermum circinale CS-539]MDB9523501.1 hypothetical protein [Dolichospermum circinale CS-1225]